LEDTIYEELNVGEITRDKKWLPAFLRSAKKVIAEISLKVIVNGTELVSVLLHEPVSGRTGIGFPL